MWQVQIRQDWVHHLLTQVPENGGLSMADL